MDTVQEAGLSSVEGFHLVQVQPNEVPQAWNTVGPMLLQDPQYWAEYYDLKDIAALLRSGRLQLWLFGPDDGEGDFDLAMLTEVRLFPKKRIMQILWIGGEGVKNALPFLDIVELTASRVGATEIRVYGRLGWVRVLARYGYLQENVILVKDISGIREH